MQKKSTCLKSTRLVTVFLVLIFCTVRTDAQSKQEIMGKLFVNLPTPTPFRDKNYLPFFIHQPYRSYDGTGNNISSRQAFEYGASDIPLYREIPANYGPSDPNNAMAGSTRPSPREISNVLSDEPVTHFNERELSSFIYVWGQFIDHDMSLTPTGTTEYISIALPADEVVFTQEIPFYRSEVRTGTGNGNNRQQTNLTTSWLDASMVYGCDSVRARWMRTFKNGKMKTSAGNYLPWNTLSGELSGQIDPNAPDMANDAGKTVKTFVAGDVRAAEHPGIAGLHTIFVREHNMICDRLVKEGFRDDELIYQMARKEVGALIQAITYQEFLPAIGIYLSPYTSYKPNIRPDIANTFATAGYRIGHTMVADELFLRTDLCQVVEPGELDLVDVFWTPSALLTYQLEPFMKGFASHTQYETDTRINSVLRNFLFSNPADATRFGIDLASLNIQRGRDHGLPDYNTVRKFYTGKAITDFSQISSDSAQVASLQKLYGDVNNIDLWIGILSEDHLPGTSVGFTMQQILKSQFEHLRDGDYYFYLSDPYLPSKVRSQIRNGKFSDVLKRNTKLTNLQSNLFFTEECPGDEEEEAAAASTDTLSTENPIVSDPKIFPNPAGNTVHVDFGSMSGTVNVQIFNIDGSKLMKSQNSVAGATGMDIGISDLSPGMYIVVLTNGQEKRTLKLIKS
jgi:peroxidase